MTSSGYNNGVSESRSYNNDNTLASISYSGAAIRTYSYTWDVNKNKTAESITGVMSGYGFSVGANGYDAEDRLVNWDRSDANLDQAWDLSPVGDWDSFTENASVQNRTHGPTHEILTVATQTVQHDPKGNMTLIPAVLRGGGVPLTMKWDFDNKLRAADTNNDGIDDVFYKWDALGRRIGRDDGTDDVVYFQVGQQTVADYQAGTAASSPTYTYVYGSYIDEMVLRTDSSSNKLYYHRNQQYSITALTDATGTISERYAYDAYGKLTVLDGGGTVLGGSAYGNRYTYTGREWDDLLGLYHYRARMYSPESGRFVSRDPIGFKGSPWNLYEYSRSAPLLYTDPAGLSWVIASGPGGRLNDYLFRIYSGADYKTWRSRFVRGGRFDTGSWTDCYTPLRERYPECVGLAMRSDMRCGQHYLDCKRERDCDSLYLQSRRDACNKECQRQKDCCELSADLALDHCKGISPIYSLIEEEHTQLGCKNVLGEIGERGIPRKPYEPELF